MFMARKILSIRLRLKVAISSISFSAITNLVSNAFRTTYHKNYQILTNSALKIIIWQYSKLDNIYSFANNSIYFQEYIFSHLIFKK